MHTLHNSRKLLHLTTALTLTFLPTLACAIPTGGSVSKGSATISNTTTQTTVTQSTQNAVINWTGFNTASSETVQFIDPNSSAITLNRISGPATSFSGQLLSNGNVWLINPQGIAFNDTAQVNVGGLLATTSNISDSNFMAGNYRFTSGGNPSAAISNSGNITVANNGLAALVAPNASNSGTIQANVGAIQLAAGSSFTVDLFGDGLINLQASPSVTNQLVSNSGQLSANGGSVTLTAAAASNIVSSLVNLDGIVQADNVTAKNQSGDLEFGGTFTKSADGSTGTATLSASRNITINNNAQITTTIDPLNVTLDARDTGRAGGAIYMAPGSKIFSNGGNIALGGGRNPLTGSAVGDNSSSGTDENGSPIYNNGIYLNNAAIIAGSGGNITLNGRGYRNSNGTPIGVNIVQSRVFTNTGGNIDINGRGGDSTSGGATGVFIGNVLTFPDASLDSFIGSDTGTIKIKGTGGRGNAGSANGVEINQAEVELTSGGISITGRGGNSPGQQSEGVVLKSSIIGSLSGSPDPLQITLAGKGGKGLLTSGVDVGAATFIEAPAVFGNIAITGDGGEAENGGRNVGVSIVGAGAHAIVSANESVIINGKGGYGSGSTQEGAGVLLSDSNIAASDLEITGKGGSNPGTNNFGIELAGFAQFESFGQAINSLTFTGTGTRGAPAIQSDVSLFDGLNGITSSGNSNAEFIGKNNSLNLNYLNYTSQASLGVTNNLTLESFGGINLGNGTSVNSIISSLNVSLIANDTGQGHGTVTFVPGTINTNGGQLSISE